MAEDITEFMIWSIEKGAWWNPNQSGYTNDAILAGRYSLEQAIDICQNANIVMKDDIPNEAMVPVIKI